MENNDIIDKILRQLEDPQTDGDALQRLVGQSEGFGPDFAARTTEAAFAPEDQGLSYYLPQMFRWVAILGVAASIALLVLTWYNHQSLNADAVAGISELSIDDAFAENLF